MSFALRKRRGPDPLSPEGVRLAIVAKLVTPESLAAKGAWGRELHILKRLQVRMPDDAFWLELSPAVGLTSLAWFLSEFGAAALREQWNLHCYSKAQEAAIAEQQQNTLDYQSSVAMIDSTSDVKEPLPELRRKQSAAEWADSPSPTG